MISHSQSGALVISLDFELHWGVRDHVGRQDPLYQRLPAARQAVREMAGIFEVRGIRATWATVGMLFASTKTELHEHLPAVRPNYHRPELNPYEEPVGADESEDPEHLAGSLVDLVATTPGQEIASHTFSHYYCLEGGQSEIEFRADLAAAQAIAHARGLNPRSLVLPRNQWNHAYTQAVLDSGFDCIRGPQRSWGHRVHRRYGTAALRRGARLVDTYLGTSAPPTTSWVDVLQPSGLCDVPASAFLRPFDPGLRHLEPLRWARLRSGMRAAARSGQIFHLWWHPHNFSRHQVENYTFLARLLEEFDRLATTEGMRSLSMGDVVDEVAPTRHQPRPFGQDGACP